MEIGGVDISLSGEKIIEFCSYYMRNREFFIEKLDMVAYLIKGISNEYLYNKTYLSSHAKDLDKLSNNIIKKNEKMKLLYIKVINKMPIELFDDISIKVDEFWIVSNSGIKYERFNSKYIISNDFYIEIILKEEIIGVLSAKDSNIIQVVEDEIDRISTKKVLQESL